MSDDTTDYAREAIEHARHAQALGDQWARHVAVLIAALAAALALAQIGENAAQDGAISYQVAVSDDWALNQAKDVRASIRAVEASVLESLPNPPDASAGAAIQAKVTAARDTEARMRDDPLSGDGTTQMAGRARTDAANRDQHFHRAHQFETVVGALQIAIVLASVSVVTRVRLFAWLAGAVGATAAVFGLAVASWPA